MALAGSPHLRRLQVHVIFLTNTSSLEVRAFFALSHLASRLTPLFGELATGLHVHQRDARCSDLVDKRVSAKATDRSRLLFAVTKSQRTTTVPKRNAALVGLAPSATAIDSTARF